MHDSTERKITYRITSKEKSFVEFIAKMIHKMGYNAWTYREGKTRNMYVVEFSKKIIDGFSIKSRDEKIDYIRGYFDAEGSIPKSRKSRFYIYFSQKNKDDLKQLKSYIEEFGIKCGKTHNPSKNVDPDYWRFYISSKSYDLFVKKIGTWHPVKAQHYRMKI